MEEGGISADGDHLLVQTVAGQLAQGLRQVDAGTHAVAGLEGVLPGKLAGHNVAPDVANDHAGVLLLAQHPFENVEGGPVGASGTEGHVPLGQFQGGGGLFLRHCRSGEGGDGGGDVVRIQFPDLGQRPVGPAAEGECQPAFSGQGLQVLLQEGVYLL